MSALTITPHIYAQHAQDVPKAVPEKPLHEWAIYDAKTDYSKNAFWSGMWKVVKLVSIVVFVALFTVAVVFTYLINEIYIPLTLAAIYIGGLDLSTDTLKWMDSKQTAYANEAKKATAILEKINQIEDSHIPEKLASMGISLKDIADERVRNNPRFIKALIARYEYHIEEKKQLEKQATVLENIEIEENGEKKRIPVREFGPHYGIEKFREVQFIIERRERCLQRAAMAHLYTAWILTILCQPTEDKKLFDYFTPLMIDVNVDPLCHIIAGYANNPHTQDMLITKAGRTFKRGDIRKMDTLKLAKELFGLRVTSNWGLF